MRTPEVIKKGLECCVAKPNGLTVKDCDIECPYFHEGVFCKNALHGDVKRIIQQLESRLAQTERERDAAVSDISRASAFLCRACRKNNWPNCGAGRNNLEPDDVIGCDDFEWRGVCDENTKEATKE